MDDWVDENNPVQAIEVFVEALDLAALGFSGVTPAATGRPAYHPAVLLKLYIYGYLNRVQSSRRLEREAIEDKLGLSGQPRVVIFHEKEGRRHAYCVWSRIDAETMTAEERRVTKVAA